MLAMAATPFREALGRHLLAIENRDLRALAETVAPGEIVLVTAEGKLVERSDEFLKMHRDWFATDGWTLEAKPVQLFENDSLGVAVLHLDYREPPATRSESYLTLVFERRDGKWLMVQDQNTPIR